MKKRMFGIVAFVIIVAMMLTLVACNDTPEASEGTVYMTGTETFWAGIGRAYMTFDVVKEAEEGALTGNVFNVMVSSDSGKNYGSWLAGKWELDETTGTLTLTATWEVGDNATYLADAESGVAKVYMINDGKYTIGVVLPSAGTKNFTLDPIANKVGEGGGKPEVGDCGEGNHVDNNCDGVCDKEGCDATVAINHIDENNDGKCDKCGGNMSGQGEKTPLVTLHATDAQTTMVAEIKVYADKTFDFILGDSKVFGGTWESSDATGQNPLADITLTYDSTGSAVVGATDTMTITPSQDYSSMTYACHVDYVVPETITMAFDFTGIFVVNS